MFQIPNDQTWFHEQMHIAEKLNNVCHLVQELANAIRMLEHRIDDNERKHEAARIKIRKKCNFFNVGFCKMREDILFQHPEVCIMEEIKRSRDQEIKRSRDQKIK